MDMIDEGAYGIVWKAMNRDTGNLGFFFILFSCYQIIQG